MLGIDLHLLIKLLLPTTTWSDALLSYSVWSLNQSLKPVVTLIYPSVLGPNLISLVTSVRLTMAMDYSQNEQIKPKSVKIPSSVGVV